MDSEQYLEFLGIWRQIMLVAAGLFLVVSLLIRIMHSIKSGSIRDYKRRHDYLKTRQSKMFWYSYLSFAIAVFFLLNQFEQDTVAIDFWWFIIRAFIALCIATIIAYVGYLVLKFYYPGKLQKKLDRLRFAPRISSTGNEMHLLSEEEEDVYLDEGMQAEENIFSVDYDVWVDEATKEIKIEKYPGYLEVLQCGTCNFQTLKLDHEEITKPATEQEEGELLKHYECTFCHSKRTTKHKIGAIIHSEREFKLPEDYVLKGERKVKSIMIEILSSTGEKGEFFFQNTNDASKFLKEFDFDNVPAH